MIHGYKSHTAPGKDKAFSAPVSALIVQVRLAPFLIGQPSLQVTEPVAADAGTSKGAHGPQILAGLPSPCSGLLFVHELGWKFFVVRAVQIVDNLNQFLLIDFVRNPHIHISDDLLAGLSIGLCQQEGA